MAYEERKFPTAPRKIYETDAELLETAMRISIPPGDWGSRGAIQYAVDIVEALAYIDVKLVTTAKFDADFVASRRADLDIADGSPVV